MKWINVGALSLFDLSNDVKQVSTKDTDKNVREALNILQADYCLQCKTSSSYFVKNTLPESCTEIWFSFDFTQTGHNNQEASLSLSFGKSLPHIKIHKDGAIQILSSSNELLYDNGSIHPWFGVNRNVEVHIKTGENGRIDIWRDTKFVMSYRSPSAFVGNIATIRIDGGVQYNVDSIYFAHFILQDTRRIGLEKFKKLTIEPDIEQNMPQGSTTTYRLSGLSDSTEFSDITSVCAVLQATSRDANITTGTFSLEGADVGTIDVSDSSGRAYEIAHAEVNSLTSKPWTRADIEGKTLSFTVNGAS